MNTIKSIFYLLFSEIVSRGISFIALIYIARVLGASELGKWGYAISLNTLLILFYTFGLDIYTMVEALKNPKNQKFLITNSFAIKTASYLCLIVALFFYTLINDTLAFLLIILLSADYLQSLYPFWFYQVQERFNTISAIKIAKSLLYLFIIFPLLIFFPSLFSLAIAYLLAHLFLGIFFAKEYLAYIDFSLLKSSSWIEIIKKALILGGALVFTQIYNSIDKIMITHMLSLQDTGFYEAGYKLYALSIVVFSIIWSVYAPKIAKEKRVYKHFLLLMLFTATIIASILFIFKKEIVSFFYGENFQQTFLLMPYFAANVFIVALSISTISPLSLLQKNREWMKITFFTLLVNIGLNALLIPLYGLKGALIATLLSEALAASLAWKTIYKIFTSHRSSSKQL